MWASDRDLLVLEPGLFRDVLWLGQRLWSGTASVSGTTLTVAGTDLAALGVGAGHVVVVDGAGLEVLARPSATALTVSRPRSAATEAAIPPAAGSGLAAAIATFRPQIAVAHRQVLRMLGLAEGEGRPGVLGETAVTNAPELVTLEAAAALHVILAAAGGLAGENSALAQRGRFYRELFERERGRVAAQLDTDGDGAADATRYARVGVWARG